MNVFIADEQARPVDTERLAALATYVLDDQQVPSEMELNLRCVEPDVISALNAEHMGEQHPTDVLAFPIDMPHELSDGEIGILGDVVLCPDVATSQAADHGKTATEELDLLLVHGVLHLLGHDHAEPDEKALMFGLTDRLLEGFAAQERPGGNA